MMHSRKLSLIGSAVIGLLLPMSAIAYVTPDQALFEDAFMNNFEPPPSTRETDSRVQRQSETSAERREREQAEYFAAQRGETEEDEMHGAAWEDGEDSESSDLEDAIWSLQQTIDEMKNGQTTGSVSARDQRILDRIAAQQETLHGGAPDGKGCVDGKGYYDGKGFDGKGVDGKGGCIIGSGAPLNESGPGSWVALGVVIAALWWTLRKATHVAAVAAVVPHSDRTLIR
jgi:hypothetical protein